MLLEKKIVEVVMYRQKFLAGRRSNWLYTIYPIRVISMLQLSYRIFLSSFFCCAVKWVGNLTLYFIMKLPRSPCLFDMGIPRPGYESDMPGPVGPPFSILSCFPSIVGIVRFHPVRASFKSKSMV